MDKPDNISEKEQAYWEGRAEAQAEIDKALDRLWDMSLADDGQAWKEAERFYSKYRDDWGKPRGK